MRIISKGTLREFWKKHAECRKDLEIWYLIACKATWKDPQAVKKQYPKASIIGNNRVVFNIHGGSYRLIVKFAYKSQLGYIRFIGTHKEYERTDVENI